MEENQLTPSSLEMLVSELTIDFVEFLKSELGAYEVPFRYYRTLENGIRATLSAYEEGRSVLPEEEKGRVMVHLEGAMKRNDEFFRI